MRQFLTVDIGRKWLRWAITNERLDVIKHGKVGLDVEDKEVFFQAFQDLADTFREEVEGLAVTMPGVIDTECGIAYSGGVYRFIRNEPLAMELKELTSLKTIIVNDAKAAALAEIGYGSLKYIDNGVMLMLLGTGIGGAIIHHGKIFNGAHFGAGEFSYLTDCYERKDDNNDMFAMSCSLNALVDLVKETTGQDNMNILKIMFGLNRGREDIIAGVKIYCKRLANYIYNIQCIIDASTFVISGNITDEPAIMDMIEKAVEDRFVNDEFQNVFQPEIKGVTFHEDSRKYGAVYEFIRLEEKGLV
jgi:predicted NBD/HSP70 family sugar kinase